MVFQDPASGIRLKISELKVLLRISFDDEPDEAVAEVTNAVVEDEGFSHRMWIV